MRKQEKKRWGNNFPGLLSGRRPIALLLCLFDNIISTTRYESIYMCIKRPSVTDTSKKTWSVWLQLYELISLSAFVKLHDSKVLESEAMPPLPNVSCSNTKPVQQYISSIWWILTLVSFIFDLQASVLDLYLAQRVCYKPHHHSCLDMYRDSKPVNSDRISNERNQVLSLRAPYNHLNILNNSH